MDKFIDKKTGKTVLEIDDEGNEKIDQRYFKDLADKKKKLVPEEKKDDEPSKEA